MVIVVSPAALHVEDFVDIVAICVGGLCNAGAILFLDYLPEIIKAASGLGCSGGINSFSYTAA